MRGFPAVLAALLAAGCGPAAPASAPAPAPGAPAAAGVPVVKVRSAILKKSIRVQGELKPFRSVSLHPKVQGYLEKVHVDVGSVVAEGQLLAELSAPELAAQRAELQARVDSADATLARLKTASGTPGVVAANDLEIAQRTAEGERARLQACLEQIAYLKLKAPFAGVVTERSAHEGSMTGPNSPSPVLKLQQVARLRLVAAVPEAASGLVAPGIKVGFSVLAHPGRRFEVAVARNPGSMDPRTRTMAVELDVDNADGKLAPGMFAELDWPLTRPEASLVVPVSSVAVTLEKVFVVRIRDGRAEWVDVRQGFTTGDSVEVFGALQEGDWVALRATDELRPGTAVTAKP